MALPLSSAPTSTVGRPTTTPFDSTPLTSFAAPGSPGAGAVTFAPALTPPASFDPYGVRVPVAARPLASVAYIRRQVMAGALLVLAGYMLWLAAGVFGGWFVTTAGASADASPAPALSYVVEPGDTLWSIATGMDTDRDVRDVVASLAETNGGAAIMPGQVLNLRPAYG